MPRPSLAQIVVVLLVAMLGLMAVAAANRARSQRVVPQVTDVTVPDAPPLKAAVTAPAARPAPRPQPKFAIVHLNRAVALRSRPGGRFVARVGATTQFGSG